VRDYHAEFAVVHFMSRPEMRGKFQAQTLLHRLWMCSGDMWAENARVAIAASRLADIVTDRSHLCKLGKVLVKAGAITKPKSGRSGVLYELCKPDHTELSAEMQLEIESMHPTDYRRKPRAQTEPRAQLELVSSQTDADIARLEDERREAARENSIEKKKKKIAMGEWLRDQGIQPSDIADFLCQMINKKSGALRYSGKGSTAVTTTAYWMAEEMVTWEEFSYVTAYIRADKSPDKPKRAEYVFEGDTEAKRAYAARMLAKTRTRLRAQPVKQ
jgi:hypothetical protein